MTSVQSRTQQIATATGVSWLSVVISLFMLAFILYIFANGSAGIYYQLLFAKTQSSAPVNTSYLGQSNSTPEELTDLGNQVAPSDIEDNPQVM